LPVIHTKILETGKPKNGDVAVFRFPEDPKVDYIKRVIGIPGDKITLQGKELLINGEYRINVSAVALAFPVYAGLS